MGIVDIVRRSCIPSALHECDSVLERLAFRMKSFAESLLEDAISHGSLRSSVIRKVPGSEVRTKTPMGYYHHTSLAARRTDLSGYTQADLDKVVLRLNQRPRNSCE
jgi:hypothetical protein